MPFTRWLKRSLSRPATKSRRPVRPRVECLEDRTVPTTFFVVPSSQGGLDGGGRGTSPSAPFANPQFAINAASSGDVIEVSAGTYTYQPQYDNFVGQGGTTGVLDVIDKQLTILGGFSPSFTQSNPSANPTVIDGGNNVHGVLVVGRAAPTSLDMEGFTIQHGLAHGNPLAGGNDQIFGFGGGMFIDMGSQQNNSAPFVLRNMTFQNNQSIGLNTNTTYGGTGVWGGLAMRIVNNMTIDSCSFINNYAAGGSGAVRGGYAGGAGLHADESHITGTNLYFANNVAQAGSTSGNGRDGTGQTADALGGALSVQGSPIACVANLVNVTATGNRTIGGNAAVNAGAADAGAFYAENATINLTYGNLQSNIIQGGTALNGGLSGGGAIESINSTINVDRTIISKNISSGGISSGGGNAGSPGGGGIYLTRFDGGNTSVSVTNSLISDNLVQFGGAAAGASGTRGSRPRSPRTPSPTTPWGPTWPSASSSSSLATAPWRGARWSTCPTPSWPTATTPGPPPSTPRTASPSI